jgi:tRNA modification GTPase
MNGLPSFRIVRLTPPGRGAIATLRVEGPGAVEAVKLQFYGRKGDGTCISRQAGKMGNGVPLLGTSSAERNPAAQHCLFQAVAHFGEKSGGEDQIVVGRFGGNDGEEVVVCRRGQQAVEIHCHGGQAAVAMIEDRLVAAGGRTAPWREWVSDHHADDSTAAAAWAALADARTERTAVILLDQYHGAWHCVMQEIRQAIEHGDADSARRQVRELETRIPLGRHLTHPWIVVLAGRPNVGKSSLLNLLAGYARAIVHHAPGTTRDIVTLTTAIDGWPVELCDTAGLWAAADAVERAGVEKAMGRLAQADLILLVADRGDAWSNEDRRLLDLWPDALLIHNKCDRPAAGGDRPQGLEISALQGTGIDAVLEAIARRLASDPPPPGAAVPFTAEQVETVRRLAVELA